MPGGRAMAMVAAGVEAALRVADRLEWRSGGPACGA